MTVIIFHGLFPLQSYYNLYFFSHFNKTEPYPCAYNKQGGEGGGPGVNSDAQNYDRLESSSPDHKTGATVTAQN